MKILATLAIVAALAGCASSPDMDSATSEPSTEPSVARKVLYGLSVGLSSFGDAWGQNMQTNPTPSLQPQRCYGSGDWVTCYPY